ncbi:MAG: 30S ribosomal protein S2 [Microgenomates group bacterium GW2011_GWF2_45_18]|nr:MAG: 30S ribosomal protein S2 [Microgenomates group bacterium GW2011_GWF1_44_10]KKU01433.1 MAG: 30S ribosomal protein S2 [Microgenomates group bacterium GW2011_GWF2_45_18]HAU98851.1 30S ribosomal protein S2 [Candidatus Paceibacterota bacterium]HAX01191.1 30S ribosomal protein S2 [Candidatus Paceibacterota bacterium]
MTQPTFEADLKALLEAGAHFGHQSQRWSPKMKQYIYDERNGVHIFDLIQTGALMQKAAQFAFELGKAGKTLLLVGTKRQAQDIIREEAGLAGAPFIAQRWLGGLITNWDQLKKSVEKLNLMRKNMVEGKYETFTKKERVLINREIARLDRFFGGVSTIKAIPDALFVIDIGKEKGVVNEAVVKEVPVIAIVDSNCDPTGIAYPIPANDDAVRSIKLITHFVADAYREGRAQCQK